ncbi:MAG: peptidoglycan editing factor PgeF [Myxococcales bacterium]|nr:peptidoglycan editing factor PgeF [Myxococcales bacterium]
MTTALRVYRSAVIPDDFLHGFPERTGGVSTGARASLNLGKSWGDDPALVEQNRARVAAHVGFAPERLQIMRHVHGTAVWRVGEPLPEPPEFDGLVTDQLGPILTTFAADCVPIVFADPIARVCGSAHAGWRGTVAGVAEQVIARMGELGARAADVRVALGPSIGACCFEVGPEVVTAFRERFGDAPGLVVAGPHKDHVDLRVALTAALTGVGVARAHVDAAPPCTRCEAARFYSYRRDGRAGGVHMGFIGRAR